MKKKGSKADLIHRTVLPQVEPIVPITRPQPFNDRAWLFEPKYDGFRMVDLNGPNGLGS
jgi:ATP-dependent DNA ligase